MRVLASVLLALLAATPAIAQSPRTISGTIEKDQTWSGDILLAGDVLVAWDATVRIAPGTRIVAAAPRDIRRAALDGVSELNPGLVEIHVRGAIEAIGNVEEPIVFGHHVDWSARLLDVKWLGIVMHPIPDRRHSRFKHCHFAGALAGVQCGDGAPEFEDCLFRTCAIGVGASDIRGDRRGRQWIDAGSPAPQIRRCRFVECETGVTVDSGGRPSISRSVFLGCQIGVGRWRGGMSGFTQGLGPQIDRCDFLHNLVATSGSGSVRNSVFRGNDLVFSASSFHRLFASQIDRAHRSHNVFWKNRMLTDADLPLGTGALHVDPGHVGPISAEMPIEGIWRRVTLKPDSKIRGKASDGGDPGSRGGVGAIRPETVAETLPTGTWAVPRWLIPGPPESLDAAARRRLLESLKRRGRATPGRKAGDAVWSLFRGSRGIVTLPPTESELVVVGAFLSNRAGPMELSLGLDGVLIEAAWNGTPLDVPKNRRRFTFDGPRQRVEAKTGRNTIVLRVRPAATGGRLGAFVKRDLTASGLTPAWPIPDGDVPGVVSSLAIKFDRRRKAARVTVKLSGAIHWPDALRPGSWRLMTPDDRILTPRPGAITYDAARRRILITGLPLRKGVLYRLLVGALRDGYGRSIPSPSEPPSARVK